MAITTAQRNSGYRQLMLLTCTAYPTQVAKIARLAVKEIKNGNATQKEIGKAVLREMYQAATGVDPVGVHSFKHWLMDALGADEVDDSVSTADAFEAEAITVN